MIGDLRAQRTERCAFVDVEPGDECACDYLPTCRGCRGDGTRWVTLGELRQPSVIDEDGCWVPTWDDARTNPSCLQHLGREKGQPLFVIRSES